MLNKPPSFFSDGPAISRNAVAWQDKISDYSLFLKLRLSMLVVFSALIGFMLVAKNDMDWVKALWLIFSGFLVAGSANGFNQVIERAYDKIMERTRMRPLPQERMSVSEGIVVASLAGITGLVILWVFLNPLSSLLSALSIALYAGAYTPVKRVSSFAVLIGAFPGAFPPLLGAVAATGNSGNIPYEGIVLFAIQFIWQFPHFWSIAWVMDEDYKKAGFRMLPSGERNKASAFQVLVYTLFLLLISMVPVLFRMTNTLVAPIIIAICGLLFCYQSVKLYRDCSVKSARELMFGSFAYLPLVQLAILLG